MLVPCGSTAQQFHTSINDVNELTKACLGLTLPLRRIAWPKALRLVSYSTLARLFFPGTRFELSRLLHPH